MGKFNPSARRKARHVLLQALYQWAFSNDPIDEISLQFMERLTSARVDADYFQELFLNITQRIEELDNCILPLLDRPIAQVNPIELAILRISTYELIYRLDVPYRVVINEGLELAKTFGAEESHKFINGILDPLAKRIRTVEVSANR